MTKRGYVIAFVLVLLIAGIGGYWAARVFLQRMQSDLSPAAETAWTPEAGATVIAQRPAVVDTPTLPPAAPDATATRAPTATVLVVEAPNVTPPPPTLEIPTITSDVVVVVTPDTTPGAFLPFEPLGAATLEPTATRAPAFPFVLAKPVRYSNGDCPGTYALGIVTDRNGSPLPNVRLNLVDEYGNGQTVTTKSGQGDAGRYDFPMFGPPRRFYMTVINDAGQPVSQRVEIFHDMAPQENKPCRWVDWRRR